jgi:nitrogen fixation/metabolism regulation signal transduction histidine kinase
LLIGIFAAAFIAAILVSRAFLRPLQRLKEATDQISRGNLDVQIVTEADDEIGELSDSFERMVAAIKYFRDEGKQPIPDDETSGELTAGAASEDTGEPSADTAGSGKQDR